ncbi:MAG: zinc finger domain-containing protein, partial [Flavobacteriales bacterium]
MLEAEIHENVEGGFDANCGNCGAKLEFEPGSEHLKCPYCGTENSIAVEELKDEEKPLEGFLHLRESESEEVQVLECEGCGSVNPFDAVKVAQSCLFCGGHLLVKNASKKDQIKPNVLIPFQLKKDDAILLWKKWTESRWFAPKNLKEMGNGPGSLKGVYVPYWTFDAQTDSEYEGQRGVYRYETERYQTTENGKSVTKTRQKRHTDWYFASGDVSYFFDDVLILGSNSLPRKMALNLDPWNFNQVTSFREEYLKGFIVESYSVSLESAHQEAKEKIESQIRSLVRQDIGGNEQRIHQLRTDWSKQTFKLLLLPIYISAYQYKGKKYQFLINGQTGEVQGERPYSTLKIVLAVLAALIII